MGDALRVIWIVENTSITWYNEDRRENLYLLQDKMDKTIGISCTSFSSISQMENIALPALKNSATRFLRDF